MSVVGYLLIAVAKVLSLLINLYTLIIAIAVLLSWVGADPYNPLAQLLRQLTEPVFARVRRRLPAALFRTGIDFSPVIVLILLVLIETILVGLLADLGRSLLK